MKLVFLSSGGGGTAKAIHSLIQNEVTSIFGKNSFIKLIADRECGATEWASHSKIPYKIKNLESEESWHELANSEPIHTSDIIITTIHKIIPSHFVEAHKDKLINLHYSILPAFQGLIGKRTITESLEYGSKLFGATCHLVTEEVDAGRPICQAVFAPKSYNTDELTHQSFLSGCLALTNGISSLYASNAYNPSQRNTVNYKDMEYFVNPCHAETQAIIEFLCQNKYN